MPKRNVILSYFPGPSLLLASFRTYLLIASEASRQAQLHPPVPTFLFGFGVCVVKPMAIWSPLHASQYQ